MAKWANKLIAAAVMGVKAEEVSSAYPPWAPQRGHFEASASWATEQLS